MRLCYSPREITSFSDLTFSDAQVYEGYGGLVVNYGTGSLVLDGFSTADVVSGTIDATDFYFFTPDQVDMF